MCGAHSELSHNFVCTNMSMMWNKNRILLCTLSTFLALLMLNLCLKLFMKDKVINEILGLSNIYDIYEFILVLQCLWSKLFHDVHHCILQHNMAVINHWSSLQSHSTYHKLKSLRNTGVSKILAKRLSKNIKVITSLSFSECIIHIQSKNAMFSCVIQVTSYSNKINCCWLQMSLQNCLNILCMPQILYLIMFIFVTIAMS